jgi:hypothetical protein
VHPVAHVLFAVHTPASPQSALATHATQVPVVVLQKGLAALPQFGLPRHCTQAFVVVSQ